jgi:hypothetical protein
MVLSTRTGLGGPDLPFPREGVRCHHVPPRRRQLGQPCHVPVAEGLPWDASPTTALNAVGGLRVPKTRHGLPTDTLGRYADTTVSLPVSKAARHCALRAGERRVVTSQRRVHEQRVMMDCCRRAEACAATVSTEATARRVNVAPSPVSGHRPNSDSTSSTGRDTDSRHCAGKAAHDHALVADTHINFSIENYRKELE